MENRVSSFTAEQENSLLRLINGVNFDYTFVYDVDDDSANVTRYADDKTTETFYESGFVDFIIVGLGLNLLTPPEGYPSELNGIASSLTQASGEKLSINRSQLAAEFVNQLVKAHQDSSAAEEYLRRRDPEDPSIIK
jgi:hypothetical protein